MRRFRVPEILLGAMFGLIFGLFVADVTSFQTEHCQNGGREQPAHEQPLNPPIDRRDGDHKPADYYQRHPISCGIGGIAPAAIGYIDENEGFFVALFTGLLFVATILLWRATNAIWDAGEKQVIETRRIGEAQVRAYVHIKHMVLDFVFDAICPRVGFIAANTGQSPARNFIWNMTLQYAGNGINREIVFNRNWLNDPPGIGIAATSESPPDAAVIPDMAIKQHVAPKASECVARLKIEFRYTDVFDQNWSGEAYFAGVIGRNKLTAEGFQVGTDGQITSHAWSGRLSPMPRPRDWDDVGQSP